MSDTSERGLLRALRARVTRAGRGRHGAPGPLVAAVATAALLPLVVSPGDSTAVNVGSTIDVAERSSGSSAQDPRGAESPERGDARAQRPRGGVETAGREIVQARPAIAETVSTVRPDLVLRPGRALDAEGIFAVVGMAEVRHLATAVELRVEVEVGEQSETLHLLAVDPGTFRSFTPDSTAQAPAVWERLSDGELVVRHDVAQRLQLPLGGFVTVGTDDPVEVRVGAFASNGSPPFADGLVPWSLASRLGGGQADVLVLALADDADAEDVGARIAERLGGAEVERVEPPSERRARLVGAGAASFEPFTYVSHGDGMITIDRAWVNRWIVSADVPIFGTVRCHRAMIPQLRAALAEVQAAGLDRHIDRRDYGGCWVPRHIMFDPRRGLSMHSWGLAIDFNVSTNQYGANPQMHPGIVDIFERWGFRWGGHWSVPDGMHFELRAVVRP